MGKQWKQWLIFFAGRWGGLQNHWRWWLQLWNWKMLTPWKESYDQPGQHIKKQRYYFVKKGPSSQGCGFSNGHVWMWELDYKENWAKKNWWFWSVVLKNTLESSLDCKKIQPVHPKGNHSLVFIGRTDVEAETSIFWPPDVKSWLIGKDPDVGKDWRRRKRGDRGWDGWMASPSQWTWVWVNSGSWWWTGRPGVLRSVVLQSDTTEQLNWTEAVFPFIMWFIHLQTSECLSCK